LTAIALACMTVAILGTRARIRSLEALEAAPAGGAAAESSLRVMLRELGVALRITPNVRRVLAVSFLVFVINSTISSLTLYLATYFWQLSPQQTERILVAGTLGSFTGLFTAWLLMSRVEKRAMMTGSILGFFACALMSVALPLAGIAPAAASMQLGVLVVALRLFGGLFYGWYLVAAGTVTLDVSDEHEVNTGRPQQGLVMSFVFLGLQAASAVAGVLAGVFLNVIEFPRGLAVEQMPADKVRALALFVCGVMIAGASLLVAVIRSFDVSHEKQAAINRRLEAIKRRR
jgi:Na+/melibiose symporter-like transporter